MKADAITLEFEPVELFGIPALFTNGRIDRDTVPPGMYAYDIRDADGRMSTIEPGVMVDHGGTIITNQKLDFTTRGYIKINGRTKVLNFAADHEYRSISAYQDYCNSNGADI